MESHTSSPYQISWHGRMSDKFYKAARKRILKDSMHIISTGMVCPVGLTAEAACAAMRAGISMFEELPYRDNNGEPIIGAVVPQLDLDCELHLRYIKMLTKAVGDCLAKVPKLATEKLPLLVALAESGRPGNPPRLEELIISQVESRLGVKFHPELSRVFSTGHTAGFEALGVSRKIMNSREVPACLSPPTLLMSIVRNS